MVGLAASFTNIYTAAIALAGLGIQAASESYKQSKEIEIANYLNRCAEGRLSSQGKQRIAAMLSIISEIESIADSCFGVAKILSRKQEGHVAFNDEIYQNIDNMFGYVKKAMKNMKTFCQDI